MSLRDSNGDILTRTGLLAVLTADPAPEATYTVDDGVTVYKAHSLPGATAHEGALSLLLAPGQAVTASQIDAWFPAATVTAITPATGDDGGGTAVTITGTNLSGVQGVTFDGVAATAVTVVDDSTVTCTTPAGTAGAVDVVVDDDGAADVTVTDGFTYTA